MSHELENTFRALAVAFSTAYRIRDFKTLYKSATLGDDGAKHLTREVRTLFRQWPEANRLYERTREAFLRVAEQDCAHQIAWEYTFSTVVEYCETCGPPDPSGFGIPSEQAIRDQWPHVVIREREENLSDAEFSAVGHRMEIELAKAKSVANTARSGPIPRSKTPDPPMQSPQTLAEARASAWKSLNLCKRQAYLAKEYAESVLGRKVEDREAWNYLHEHGIPEDRGNLQELQSYELPSYETFTTYLSRARNARGELEYKKGNCRGSRSLVERDEI